MINVTACCDLCGTTIPTDAKSMGKARRQVADTWVFAKVIDYDGEAIEQLFCICCAELLGFLVKCNGEAHSNGFIDNCGTCMPRWSLVLANPMPVLRITEAVEKYNDHWKVEPVT